MGLAEAVFITGVIILLLGVGAIIPLLVSVAGYSFTKGKIKVLFDILCAVFLHTMIFGCVIGTALSLAGFIMYTTK